MSRKFRNDPITIVLGSTPKRGPDPDWARTHPGSTPPIVDLAGLPEPLKTAAGRPVGRRIIRPVPLFEGGKVVGVNTHFINEAAKRRANGDFKNAKPSDVVLVPVYRGVAASMVTYMRAVHRRIVAREQARLAAESEPQMMGTCKLVMDPQMVLGV